MDEASQRNRDLARPQQILTQLTGSQERQSNVPEVARDFEGFGDETCWRRRAFKAMILSKSVHSTLPSS
jgi:hypothetical protein